jgi:thiol-disulfide isomerase/thioredoxin
MTAPLLRVLPFLALLLLFVASPVRAETEPVSSQYLLVQMEGMECAGCNKRLGTVFSGLDWLDEVHASFAVQAACGRLVGTVDEPSLQTALGEGRHKVLGTKVVDVCPEGLRGRLPQPWDGKAEGLDVVTISHGEVVDLDEHLAAGKYTVIDFGASWCGPCHEAADVLATFLEEHSDVAVRAVELGGETAQDSYEQPVVAQHLSYVSGIPWLVVYSPDGKVIGKNRSVEKVMALISKHRSKTKKQ